MTPEFLHRRMTTSNIEAERCVGEHGLQFRRWTSGLAEHGVLWDQGAREAIYMDVGDGGVRERGGPWDCGRGL